MDNTVKFKGNGIFEVDLDSIIEDKNDIVAPLLDDDKDIYREEFLTEGEARWWRANRKRTDNGEYQHINEETYKNLVKMSDAKRKARASKLKTRYLGVTPGRGWIKFQTQSQRIRGKYYTQYIKLAEAKDMKYFKEFNQRDIVRLFMSGDVQVFCSCNDFRYRLKYAAYHLGYGIFKENRYPKIRNPNFDYVLCKHLICVLKVIGLNWTSIAKDMKNTKFYKRKIEDIEYMKELEKKRAFKKKMRRGK